MIPDKLQSKSRYLTDCNMRVDTQQIAIQELIPNKLQYQREYPTDCNVRVDFQYIAR